MSTPLTNESIEFRCSQCQQLLKVAASLAGRQVRCPQCSAVQNVPQASAPVMNPGVGYTQTAASPGQPLAGNQPLGGNQPLAGGSPAPNMAPVVPQQPAAQQPTSSPV